MTYNDPVAGALAALMDVGDEQRPVLKLSALKNVLASGLTEGDKLFLMKLIDSYLPTTELINAKGEVVGELADIELTHIERLELEFMQKGVEKGLAEGREEGRAEGREEGREEGELLGKRELLLRLLTHRFGELPVEITQRIERIRQHSIFDALVEQALTVESVDQLTITETIVDAEEELEK